MYDNTKAIGHETIYIKLNDFGSGFCPYCASEVEELYCDGGHSFQSMFGWKHFVTYWYQCTNSNCPSGGKFKAPQPYVLPYKKFGQDVWLFICFEWEKFKTSPPEIKERLKYLGIYISEDTVREILTDYKLLKNKKTDKTTLNMIQNQGVMIIGCDGTPIEKGSPSLWTFYDVITGRMLFADLLDSADANTLLSIFQDIQKRYNVPVVGFLSDHQPSIVKACKLFDPNIPHQTCHYHFLRNHWNFITEKDTHLNKELRKVINNLPIGNLDPNGGAIYSKNLQVEKKSFFESFYRYLKKIVYFKNDEFKELKGMKAYEKLTELTEILHTKIKTLDLDLRPTKQLMTSMKLIVDVLRKFEYYYDEIKELFEHFQIIRIGLGDDTVKKEDKINGLESKYSDLFKQFSPTTKYKKLEDVKSKECNYKLKNDEIICEWCRLWSTHRENLFFYYDVKGMEKTNIYNEQVFSLLKRQVVKSHGLSHKNYMVFTRGSMYTTDICDKSSVNIQEVLTSYNLKEITRLKQPLQEKKDRRRAEFRNSKDNTSCINELISKIRNHDWE